MALEVTHRQEDTTVALHTIEERLYQTADGEVVAEGHPDAAFLFATPGDEIPLEQADQLGLLKQRQPARNKQRQASADKGETKR